MKLYALVPAATYALSTAAPPTIKIRFVNTKEGADVTTEVRENTNLLNAADDAGVKIPRACRNGLCGACQCTLITEDGDERYMRACSTSVKAIDAGAAGEFVVDVSKKRRGAPGVDDDDDDDDDVMAASMARFSDDWENAYVPDYHTQNNAAPSWRREFDDEPAGGDWTEYSALAGSGYGGSSYGGDLGAGDDDGWRELAMLGGAGDAAAATPEPWAAYASAAAGGDGAFLDDAYGAPAPAEDAPPRRVVVDDDADDMSGGLAPWDVIQ